MSNMLVANAPVSWGVYEADDDNPPFGTILDAIAESGYGGTELGPYGYLPTERDRLARELERRGLKLGSSFVPMPLEDPARRAECVSAAMNVAGLLVGFGVNFLIVADDEDPARAALAGRIPDDGSAGWNKQQWKEACATLDAVAAAVHDAFRMRVVIHHHAGTFIETPAEIDRALRGTDPKRVGLLLDTGHCLYGGGDPLAVYEKHASRTWYVHLKDADRAKLAAVRETDIAMQDAWKGGVFCPLGQGAADFPALLEALRARDYAGWLVVEQDVVPGEDGKLDPDPFVAAQQSRAFLKTLGV
jgi:inosose dehydratase